MKIKTKNNDKQMKCKVKNMQNIKKIMEKRYEQKFFPKKNYKFSTTTVVY